MKATVNVSVYRDILDNLTLPALRERFGDGSFLFNDCAPVHKALWVNDFGVGEVES